MDLHTGLATQEIVETAKSGAGFVEVGYISNVHGLQGEICVKPSTEFPELRFSKVVYGWKTLTSSSAFSYGSLFSFVPVQFCNYFLIC